MKVFTITSLFILILSSSACSHRAFYEAAQENKRQECSLMVGRAYEECMNSLTKDYQEYKQQREEALSEKQGSGLETNKQTQDTDD